jgi:hypothetical protein
VFCLVAHMNLIRAKWSSLGCVEEREKYGNREGTYFAVCADRLCKVTWKYTY